MNFQDLKLNEEFTLSPVYFTGDKVFKRTGHLQAIDHNGKSVHIPSLSITVIPFSPTKEEL